MANEQKNNAGTDFLRAKAVVYANIDVEKLARLDLGEASFESILDDLKALKSFAQRVWKCDWNGVPKEIILELGNKFDLLEQPIQQLDQFSVLTSGNLIHERERRIRVFKEKWKDLFVAMAPILCFAETTDTGFGNLKESLAKVLIDATATKEDLDKKAIQLEKMMAGRIDAIIQDQERKNNASEAQIKKQMAQALKDQKEFMELEQKRINLVVTQTEEMAKGKAVSIQTVQFGDLAEGYKKGCRMWSGFAVIVGLALCWYVNDFHPPVTDSNLKLLASIFPRVVVITLLSTALIFCIRNFSAQMHNLVVNRHRQKALTTFEVFVNATTDPDTKNAVLIQSTQAIFAPQPSGYLKTDQEMPQINQVTEIVRGMSGKNKD